MAPLASNFAPGTIVGGRYRVESLLGQQVHLKIWVRVVPRWYESPSKLVELGYGLALAGEDS